MKYLRIFLLTLSVLLVLTSCGQDIPVMAETETEAETDAVTEPIETEPAETEPKEPKKRVAITFDDGPAFDNDSVQRLTYKIVDEFEKYGGTATFFVLGNRINATTGKAIQYANEHGFEFGIHAYTHEIYFDNKLIISEELAETAAFDVFVVALLSK